MDPSQPNGNGADGTPRATLTLTLDLLASTMKIEGKIPNADVALDMLARATRHYEGVVRLEQVQEYARKQQEAARTREIVNRVRGNA